MLWLSYVLLVRSSDLLRRMFAVAFNTQRNSSVLAIEPRTIVCARISRVQPNRKLFTAKFHSVEIGTESDAYKKCQKCNEKKVSAD